MKSFDLPKINLIKKQSFQRENKPSKEKFPKIEKSERLEKKPKKEEKHESIFSPPVNKDIQIISTIDTNCPIKTIAQLAKALTQKIVIQKKEALTETNFTIQTKYFDEVEIVIKLFDTNPYTYHITILGNQKIQNEAIKHQNILTSEINKALPHIKVHITPPALRKKDRFESKKKKGIEKTLSTCYGANKRLIE
ncbi:MAG: hypothetical protein S4CHLAM20_07330 [Chlamydiia bacterium]|nr:hypothetical protein [Chlamydiia bacterium]